MGGAASEEDPAGRDLDEEEDVEATQQDRVDGEEVAGQDSPRVSAEEIAPTHFAPSRSRWNPAVMKDAANRGRRHVDAELAQLALDPQIAPGWIVRGQAGDKIPRLGRDRGPAEATTPSERRPLSAHQLPVPADHGVRADQQRPPRRPGKPLRECGEDEPVAR